jgi:hypothetical protein
MVKEKIQSSEDDWMIVAPFTGQCSICQKISEVTVCRRTPLMYSNRPAVQKKEFVISPGMCCMKICAECSIEHKNDHDKDDATRAAAA